MLEYGSRLVDCVVVEYRDGSMDLNQIASPDGAVCDQTHASVWDKSDDEWW